MSFIRTKRLFANKIKLSFIPAYFFDVFALIILLLVVYDSIPQLRQFSHGAATVTARPSAISLIGALGLYGVRISTYIAIARRNRIPQVAEWWATLIGLGLVFFCMMFSGTILDAYAHLHGYQLCHVVSGNRLDDYLFARACES